MKVPEQYRFTQHPKLASTRRDGNNGFFLVPTADEFTCLSCIASDGEVWEHVSVTVVQCGLDGQLLPVRRTPTWEEMCLVRDLFWSKYVTVLQFHPPASQYVNVHEWCLHLWRQPGITVRLPHPRLVG